MITNELRIGNWVNSELYGDYKIIGISNFSENNALFWKSYNYYPQACSIDSLKGIHLTEEWLVKLGAKKTHDLLNIFELDRFELHPLYIYDFWEVVDKETKTYITKASYVHELQNMYFVLNGEELQL